jgi:hypothetical protein
MVAGPDIGSWEAARWCLLTRHGRRVMGGAELRRRGRQSPRLNKGTQHHAVTRPIWYIQKWNILLKPVSKARVEELAAKVLVFFSSSLRELCPVPENEFLHLVSLSI